MQHERDDLRKGAFESLQLTKRYEPPHGNVRTLRFSSPRNGWATAYGQLLVTSDGGYSWHNRYPTGFDDQYLAPQAICPVGSSNCWLVASYASKDVRFFQSSDRGRSWTERGRFFAEKYNIIGQDLFFADDAHGWILFFESNDGRRFRSILCRTDDGGENWSKIALNGSGRPQGIVFADDRKGWIAEKQPYGAKTRRGTIIHSTMDGGLTWNRISIPGAGARYLSLAPNGNLFLCGEKGLLASSGDSGKTWQILRSHTQMILESMDFRGRVGIAAGNGDSIRSTGSVVFLLTRDAGRCWKRIESPIRASIVGVYLTAWDRGVLATAEALYHFKLP